MKQEFDVTKLFTRGKSQLQLAITTLVVLLLAVSSIFTLVYTYIETSDGALKSAWQMMKSTNRSMRRDVLRYLGTAKRTVTATTYGFKDVSTVRGNYEKLFPVMMGQLKAQREIFAISAGDSTGSLLMVGKIFEDPKYSVNKAKPLPAEVAFRSHYVDKPAGIEYYLYLDKKMKVVDREVVPAGKITYDARTKTWYMDADKAKGNTWTDVRIYGNGEFGTANVEAIRDAAGKTNIVISASIALSLKDGISSRLNVGQNGFAFILDGDGKVIAYPEMDKITRCEENAPEPAPQAGAAPPPTVAKPGQKEPRKKERTAKELARQRKQAADPAVKEPPPKCRFAKADEVENPALAAAFHKYKEKSNLSDGKNIPKRLNYQDYHKAVKRLEAEPRKAFDKIYTLNDEKKTITLNPNLPKEVIPTVDDVLESVNYTYNMRFSAAGEEYLASFQDFPDSYGKEWMIGILVPVNDFIGALKTTILHVTLISLAILMLSIGAIIYAAHRILAPLKLIAQDMNRIQNLDIDESVRHRSFFYEILLIADALASMKHGLKAFSKFVPFTLVKQLIESGKGAELGGEKRHLTMMFTDIAGFTTISESMTTEELLIHISEYLDSLTKIILAQQGTVDKYIGDAIMSFWGAPLPDAEQEYHSCKTALLCTAKLKDLNKRWIAEGKPELYTRFGISSGDVSVGNMGSSDRMNYTVLGDSVNLASRLEAINKYYGTNIIVGESTYEKVKSRFCFRPVDVVAVKGKSQGVRIYHLLAGLPGDDIIAPTKEDIESQELTEKAFNAYMEQDFEKALALYTQLGKTFPEDPLAEMFIERCKAYIKKAPPRDWDGVYVMKSK